MALYAQTPARRTRQVVADVLVVVWVVVWVLVGRAVHGTVARLAAPGRTVEDAGTSLGRGLADAGASLERVPLVGGELRSPFDAAGSAAASIADAGAAFQDGVSRAALVAGLAVAVWPILIVIAVWVVARVRFVRRHGAAQRLVAGGADLDLFALRALTRLPLPVLSRVSADPAGDWRRGDAVVVRRLAELELTSVGVRPAGAVSPPR